MQKKPTFTWPSKVDRGDMLCYHVLHRPIKGGKELGKKG